MEYKRYTITSALPYANGPLHIGHIAGAYLPADLYVRYLRLRGRDVVWVCGSDEHGAAITLRAKKEGISPREIIDRYHTLNQETFARFGISFDYYHRTSEPLHHETSQGFFTTLYEKGEFIEQTTEQFFDEEYQQFLADRYVMGTCPVCSYEAAYGDQCEKCGSSLNPTDLINPVSTLSGKTPVLRETRHWYLPLDKYQPWLEEWLLEGKKGIWKNNVYGQCSSWLKAGLQPRSMTRDLDWGVDVPLPDTEGKKLYVWLDAPIGYVSSTRQWALENGKDWELYWKEQADPADNSRLIHFIGKDNIVFHCIIFPAILHTHGGYLVPDNVPANEFLNLEGDKMSTSRNYAVWLHEFLDEFPGKEDVLRYALCAIMPENKDADFTWKDFQARNNNELAAILGNFVNRVMVLTNKFFDGVVPEPVGIREHTSAIAAYQEVQGHIAKIEEALENFRFRDAQAEFINIARVGNRFLTEQEPWKKIKTDPEAVKPVMWSCLEIIGAIATLSKIFLPFTAPRIFDLLQLDPERYTWDHAAGKAGDGFLVPPGHQIKTGKNLPVLFEQIPDEVIQVQLDKLAATHAPASEGSAWPPVKEEISFDDFQKMDIRIGTILEAQKVPKADKLLQFKVDTGVDVRTIVSGVAKYFAPEDLVGKQVPVLINLAPRKIRGVVSQGMILFAEGSDGHLYRMSPAQETESGAAVN
ncbi:MAG: methionine--tRNA ligase [Bacteroidetes bacterium]|nr:MAG: methionine--tRNA ligase [Bacteroidota bacterium]